jgi:hypothetical protein
MSRRRGDEIASAEPALHSGSMNLAQTANVVNEKHATISSEEG